MMKASFSGIFLLIWSAAAGCCDATPFETRSYVLRKKLHRTSDAIDGVLSIRGGGVLGTPVTKENLATLYTLSWGSVGALGMPAPEKMAEIFGFTLQEGTLAYLMFEWFASTCVGLGVMSYLAVQTSTPAAKIAMYGALSCFYAVFRNTLKGSFDKTGFMDYFGVVQLVIFCVCTYCIQTGTDPTLAAKALAIVPLLLGAVGSLDPDLGGKLFCGLSKQIGVTRTVCLWFYQSLLMWGVMSWSLLSGESAFKSIGLASLAVTFGVVDNTFLRKANKELGLSDAVSYTYLVSAASIAVGLLLD